MKKILLKVGEQIKFYSNNLKGWVYASVERIFLRTPTGDIEFTEEPNITSEEIKQLLVEINYQKLFPQRGQITLVSELKRALQRKPPTPSCN